jgi:hypothetical protein
MREEEAAEKLEHYEALLKARDAVGTAGQAGTPSPRNISTAQRESARDTIRRRVEHMRRDGLQKIKDADALEQLLSQVGHVSGDAEAMLWRMACNL